MGFGNWGDMGGESYVAGPPESHPEVTLEEVMTGLKDAYNLDGEAASRFLLLSAVASTFYPGTAASADNLLSLAYYVEKGIPSMDGSDPHKPQRGTGKKLTGAQIRELGLGEIIMDAKDNHWYVRGYDQKWRNVMRDSKTGEFVFFTPWTDEELSNDDLYLTYMGTYKELGLTDKDLERTRPEPS